MVKKSRRRASQTGLVLSTAKRIDEIGGNQLSVSAAGSLAEQVQTFIQCFQSPIAVFIADIIQIKQMCNLVKLQGICMLNKRQNLIQLLIFLYQKQAVGKVENTEVIRECVMFSAH